MKVTMALAIVALLGLIFALNVFPALLVFAPETLDDPWVRPAARASLVATVLGTVAVIFPTFKYAPLLSRLTYIALIVVILVGGGVFISS